MQLLDTFTAFVDLSNRSFQNASTTMERVHQTSAEMSLDLLTDLGFPAEVADSYRESHRTILAAAYGWVRDETEGFGQRLVRTAERLTS